MYKFEQRFVSWTLHLATSWMDNEVIVDHHHHQSRIYTINLNLKDPASPLIWWMFGLHQGLTRDLQILTQMTYQCATVSHYDSKIFRHNISRGFCLIPGQVPHENRVDIILHQWVIFFLLTWLLYISTSNWVLHTPNAGWNILFQPFFVQKSRKRKKKQQICCKIWQTNVFF